MYVFCFLSQIFAKEGLAVPISSAGNQISKGGNEGLFPRAEGCPGGAAVPPFFFCTLPGPHFGVMDDPID